MIEAKKIYRKEDIELMGTRAVKSRLGTKGAEPILLWLNYKGGGACHHYWSVKLICLHKIANVLMLNHHKHQQ